MSLFTFYMLNDKSKPSAFFVEQFDTIGEAKTHGRARLLKEPGYRAVEIMMGTFVVCVLPSLRRQGQPKAACYAG